MLRPDRLIGTCTSWDEFWESTKKLSMTEKGAAFERLTQLYLQTTPEYQSNLNTSGHFARCRRKFADFSPFQPSTKASTS